MDMHLAWELGREGRTDERKAAGDSFSLFGELRGLGIKVMLELMEVRAGPD